MGKEQKLSSDQVESIKNCTNLKKKKQQNLKVNDRL